jgi:hypothetical protein
MRDRGALNGPGKEVPQPPEFVIDKPPMWAEPSFPQPTTPLINVSHLMALDVRLEEGLIAINVQVNLWVSFSAREPFSR